MLTQGVRAELLFYFLLEVLAIGLTLLFVYWSKKVVDLAVQADSSLLNKALVVMVAALVLSVLARILATWLNERTRMKMLISLQNKLLHIQMRATWQFVNRWRSGDIQVRIQEDAREAVQMAGYAVINVVVTSLSLLGSYALLWHMDHRLALMLLALLPLFFLSKIYFKKMRVLNRDLKAARSRFGNVVQESVQYKLLIRALSIFPSRWQKVETSQDDIYALQQAQLNFSSFSHGLVRLLATLGFLVAFVWGVYRLHAGLLTFGTLTAFLQLVGRVQAPVLALMAFAPLFIRYRTSADRLMSLLSVEVELEIEGHRLQGLQQLQVKNLSFRYEDELVIRDLTMQVQCGESVAIMGGSGRGKTTFIRLLLALLRPTQGDLLLETDQGVHVLGQEHRVNMAYVPQGGKLFSGTVRENLETMDGRLSDEAIAQALYLGCAEFVYELPNGLDTVVGEEGYGLSEGQAQRIAIARAMVRDTSIWLLDEITSALDEETADKMMTRLLEAGKDKIILFVTHDIRLAHRCQRIIAI